MLVIVLDHTAEKRERNGSLDILMSVYRRCNRFNDALADALVVSKSAHLFFILLREPEGSKQVLLFVDVIGLDNRRKDWEAIFGVEGCVEIIAVNARDFLFVRLSAPGERTVAQTYHFFAWLCTIDEIPKQNNFAMPWQPTSRHRSRRFLQRHLLIVSVHRLQEIFSSEAQKDDGINLFGIDCEWPFALAIATETDLDFGSFASRILVERPKSGFAFSTIELDVF